MVALINSLLANMEGERDRVPDLSRLIQPHELPSDLPFHRDLLAVFNDCSARSIPPTKENLLHGLGILYNRKGAGAVQALDAVLAERTVSGDVNSLSSWLEDDIRHRAAKAAWERGDHIMNSFVGTPDQRLERAVQEVIPFVATSEGVDYEYDSDAMLDFMDQVIDRRFRQFNDGVPPGPSLKFRGFTGRYNEDGTAIEQGKVPFLRWGQTTLVTGPSKSGKTLFGGVWAEHNAWRLGIDVLYLHLETETESMGDRMIVRNALIPLNYLTSRGFDRNSDHAAAIAYRQFRDWAAKPVKKHTDGELVSGELTYKYCPGWDIFKINAAIGLQRRKSDARGRGLLVIVDYYNLIDRSNFGNMKTNEALGKVAYYLREAVKRENALSQKCGGTGIHCIVFAQQSGEGDDVTAFGSSEIVQYAQLHISIVREDAKNDMVRVVEGANGKPQPDVDALGNQRYWHRKGSRSSNTILRVVRGNEASRGDVNVLVEDGYYRAEDLPA